MSDSDTIEFFYTLYRRTTDIYNCSVGNDMFLNSNKELWVIVERYEIAGSDSAEIILILIKKEWEIMRNSRTLMNM